MKLQNDVSPYRAVVAIGALPGIASFPLGFWFMQRAQDQMDRTGDYSFSSSNVALLYLALLTVIATVLTYHLIGTSRRRPRISDLLLHTFDTAIGGLLLGLILYIVYILPLLFTGMNISDQESYAYIAFSGPLGIWIGVGLPALVRTDRRYASRYNIWLARTWLTVCFTVIGPAAFYACMRLLAAHVSGEPFFVEGTAFWTIGVPFAWGCSIVAVISGRMRKIGRL